MTDFIRDVGEQLDANLDEVLFMLLTAFGHEIDGYLIDVECSGKKWFETVKVTVAPFHGEDISFEKLAGMQSDIAECLDSWRYAPYPFLIDYNLPSIELVEIVTVESDTASRKCRFEIMEKMQIGPTRKELERQRLEREDADQESKESFPYEVQVIMDAASDYFGRALENIRNGGGDTPPPYEPPPRTRPFGSQTSRFED
ncbi:MAG: hypothetical protein FWE46_03115 [Coriobacteriia bacterium]|nr:hypothetical protein [Coriobacteriia bacterium]MCL2537317.1 hypothetical protein [Coriobacteriia bacterium]